MFAEWCSVTCHCLHIKPCHKSNVIKLPLANPQNWIWMQIVPLRDQYCSRLFFFKILPRAEATNSSSLPQVTVTVPDDAPPGTVLAIPIRGSISAWWDLPVDFQWHMGHNVYLSPASWVNLYTLELFFSPIVGGGAETLKVQSLSTSAQPISHKFLVLDIPFRQTNMISPGASLGRPLQIQ